MDEAGSSKSSVTETTTYDNTQPTILETVAALISPAEEQMCNFPPVVKPNLAEVATAKSCVDYQPLVGKFF